MGLFFKKIKTFNGIIFVGVGTGTYDHKFVMYSYFTSMYIYYTSIYILVYEVKQMKVLQN